GRRASARWSSPATCRKVRRRTRPRRRPTPTSPASSLRSGVEMAAKKRQVDIKSRRTAYKGRYRIEEVLFDFDRIAGKGRITDSKREVFDRGDSAAALIHDVERDVIVAAQQFRVATYDKGPGYLIEAMAGSVEEGEDPETCIRREMMEEVGYRAGNLTLVSSG